MNYYPFHIGDYASHTTHLTDAEDLAYRRMIDLYYMNEHPFNDCSTVARRIRASVETVEIILAEFFEFCEDNCWHHKRIDEEIAKYRAKQTQAARAGKASAEARLNARSTPVQPTNNQKPTTKTNINTISPPVGVSDSVFNDYIKLRNKLKAPVTQTAIKGLQTEANKAGLSLEQVMVICCQNGWRGFKAEWVKNQSGTFRERDAAASSQQLRNMMLGNVDPQSNQLITIEEMEDAKRLLGK